MWLWQQGVAALPPLNKQLLPFKLFYLTYFSALACLQPFLPVFFREEGLSEGQIGLLGSVRPWIGIFMTPLWGLVADITGRKKAVLLASLVGATTARFLLFFGHSFLEFLPLVVMVNVMAAGGTSLMDTLTIQALHNKADYGKQRLWGAVGWGTFSVAAGALVTATNIRIIFFCNAAMMSIAILVSALSFSTQGAARRTQLETASNSGGSSEGVNDSEASSDEEASLLEKGRRLSRVDSRQASSDEKARSLAGELAAHRQARPAAVGLHEDGRGLGSKCERNKKERGIPVADFSGDAIPVENRANTEKLEKYAEGVGQDRLHEGSKSSGLAGSDESTRTEGQTSKWKSIAVVFKDIRVLSFFSVVVVMGIAMGVIDGYLLLYLHELGGSATLLGLSLTVTCMAEVPMMAVSGPLMKRIGVVGMLYLVLAGYAIRCSYYSILRHPWAVLPIELLHGITFGCAWTTCTVHTGNLAPPGLEATMQGILSATYFGFGTGTGVLAGGAVYQKYGAVIMFRFTCMVVVVGGLLFAASQSLSVGKASQSRPVGNDVAVKAESKSRLEKEQRGEELERLT